MKTLFSLLLGAFLLQGCGCSQARHIMHGTSLVDSVDTAQVYIDTLLKYPVISDDSLLTLVQERTFKYFWEYAKKTPGYETLLNVLKNFTEEDAKKDLASGDNLMNLAVAEINNKSNFFILFPLSVIFQVFRVRPAKGEDRRELCRVQV